MSDFNNKNDQLFIFYMADQAIISNSVTPVTGILSLERALPNCLGSSKFASRFRKNEAILFWTGLSSFFRSCFALSKILIVQTKFSHHIVKVMGSFFIIQIVLISGICFYYGLFFR